MKLEISAEFEDAIDQMEHSQDHLFITGKAGAGKSTLLDYYCQHSQKNPVVLAPTGVAALNVKGQTIHSFFNFYIDVTVEKIVNKEIEPYAKRLYKKLKTIIIDEVSMVRADLLDCVDAFLRLYGPDEYEPFGGVQMIFVGDLYQLPPVVTQDERHIFKTHYESPFFFSAHVFKEISFKCIELTKIYRQKDEHFVTLLNQVRNNNISFAALKNLNQRYIQIDAQNNMEDFYIHLTTTNQKADEINQGHLDKLPGELYATKAKVVGDFTREYFPTLERMQYKVGAQVMLINNDANKRWVNGSIGVIKAIVEKSGKKTLMVLLQDSKEQVAVQPFTWEVYRFSLADNKIISEPVGTFTQFPVRLAWAITIHKSQGKTFEKVVIDLGRGTFVPGQLYVALSRCTTLEGIVLKQPIQKRHIDTDPRIARALSLL
ncbi:MAG: ATP-dependent RecD-like DNA helicase [Candidatus Berkiella sp.]